MQWGCVYRPSTLSWHWLIRRSDCLTYAESLSGDGMMGVEWILDVFYCHLKTIYLLLMDTGLISIMRYKQDLTQRGSLLLQLMR